MYLIRLDDITEGTNWDYFEHMEKYFDKYQIKPILGVVPDNKDENIVDKNFLIPKKEFFNKIKKYQDKGYTIAMHGIKHILKPTNKLSLININKYGEAVDLSMNQKLEYFLYGKEILNTYGIHTDIYMPPAHWIDFETIEILKELGFKYITDGLFLFPKNINGIWFIPQQLWRVRNINIIRTGLFTICLHINMLNNKELEKIILFIEKYHDNILSFEKIKYYLNSYQNNKYVLANHFSEFLFNILIKAKRFFNK